MSWELRLETSGTFLGKLISSSSYARLELSLQRSAELVPFQRQASTHELRNHVQSVCSSSVEESDFNKRILNIPRFRTTCRQVSFEHFEFRAASSHSDTVSMNIQSFWGSADVCREKSVRSYVCGGLIPTLGVICN